MRAIFFATALLLAACADPAETCSSYGFQPGSEAYANCQMQVSQANSERSQRMSVAMNGMTLQGQQQMQPRLATRCIRNAYGFTCND